MITTNQLEIFTEMAVDEEDTAILALRQIRQSKKRAKKRELQNSLRNTLPSAFVNALAFAPKLSPLSTPIKENKNNASRDSVCKYCQKRPTKPDVECLLRAASPKENQREFDEMSDEAMLVTHQLKLLKEERRRSKTQQQLSEVLERVQGALDYSGVKMDEDYVPSFQADLFNINDKKQKKKTRSFIYDMFNRSAKLGLNRDNVMKDVGNWFTLSCDDLAVLCNLKPSRSGEVLLSDDYFVRIHKAFRKSTESVNKLIQAFQKSMELSLSGGEKPTSRHGKRKQFVASKGTLSLPSPANISNSNRGQRSDSHLSADGEVTDPESLHDSLNTASSNTDSSNTTHKIKMNIKKLFFTENELNDPKEIQQAFKLINTLITDGVKHAVSPQAKSCYKIGAKQLKAIVPVLERKVNLISELEVKVKTLVTEVTNTKLDNQNQQANDENQILQLLNENQKLREEMENLHKDLMMEREKTKNVLKIDVTQQSASRQVSIKLPEKPTHNNNGDESDGSEYMRTLITKEKRPEVDVPYRDVRQQKDDADAHLKDDNGKSGSIESVEKMQENLKMKLSSQRNVLQPGSITFSRNASSHQSMISKGNETAPVTHISVTKFSKNELYDYDSELASFHENFESVADKPQHQTDNLRKQIHMLREELRHSDNRYYEQRAELEDLRQIRGEASQPASKPTSAVKEKQPLYEKTIEELQITQNLLQKEIVDKRDDLSAKQQIIDTLQQQLRELIEKRKHDSNDSSKEKPTSPPRVSTPLSADNAQMPRDQLIKKITLQSEAELNCLRQFIVHEQQRFRAYLRQSNLESSKQLSKLQNEHAHLVRVIAHFKDTVDVLLRGENFTEDAQENAPTLSVFSNNNTEMESGAAETLVKIKRRLCNIFMNNKVSLKHINATKANTEKHLEQCRTQLQKRNVDFTDQQQLVKRAELRNEELSRQCKQLAYVNHNLRRELEPCKEIMKKYQSIQERVDNLQSNEKEHEREKRQLKKDLDADRNRLRREVDQLMSAQICALRKYSFNQMWSSLECSEKKSVVQKVYSMNQLTGERKDPGTEILELCNQLAVQQLAGLVTRYMDLCRFKRIKEAVKATAARRNHDIRFSAYLELMAKRHDEAKSIWEEHYNAIRAERKRASFLLKQVLADSFEEPIVPGIQQSKRSYPKPPKQQHRAESASEKYVQLPTTENTIIGQCIVKKTAKQAYWKAQNSAASVGGRGNNFAQVTIPRILAMDIEKCRQPKIVTQKVKSYLPPIAELFP